PQPLALRRAAARAARPLPQRRRRLERRGGAALGAQPLRRRAHPARRGRALGPALRGGRGRRRPARGGGAAGADGAVSGLAVVAGAGGSIGGAIAAALAEAGHELLLVGRSPERVAPLAERHGARFLRADLEVAGDVERACAELRRLEEVAVAVYAAGRLEHGALAAFALTRALLPALRAAGGQLVVVNSSAAARRAAAAEGPYAASKHALRAFADAVRAEENEAGVRVLSGYPGRTAGPLQERLHEREGRAYRPERLLQPADVAAAVLSALSLPRTAEVTDVHVRPMVKPE